MSAFVWILLAALYLTALFVLGLTTLRKGHTVLFWFGILFPLLWIAGAADGAHERGGCSEPDLKQSGKRFGQESRVLRLSPVVWVPSRGLSTRSRRCAWRKIARRTISSSSAVRVRARVPAFDLLAVMARSYSPKAGSTWSSAEGR